jgi:hypothetical protein
MDQVFTGFVQTKKPGFKNPVPNLASLWGGKKSNRRTGTGVSNLKIGITTVSCSYPSCFYYYNVPGFHGLVNNCFPTADIPFLLSSFAK